MSRPAFGAWDHNLCGERDRSTHLPIRLLHLGWSDHQLTIVHPGPELSAAKLLRSVFCREAYTFQAGPKDHTSHP